MKNAKTEIKASFLVQGFQCTHDELTASIGIAPSAVWSKGDQIAGAKLRRKENGWRLDSELPPTAALDQHAQNILERLYPRAMAVISIDPAKRRFFAACYIYARDRPPLVLSSEIIRQLAELKAGVDIDIYNL